jgi:hypothetical protein
VKSDFVLSDYLELFRPALKQRYDTEFGEGLLEIEKRYKKVRSGSDITVEDVMAIFKENLPFVHSWTKPDADELASRMSERNVANAIRRLGDRSDRPVVDDRDLVTEVLGCFRELGLTALVLHHACPKRFAMCSHHLASLLRITAPTVPTFYIEYCTELKVWSERDWHSSRRLTVVEVEFALWTWYRFAYHIGTREERKVHQKKFQKDRWVQRRRAERIAKSLGNVEKLDLARSYLNTSPTVTAIIAWRELETAMRETLRKRGENSAAEGNFPILLAALALDRRMASRVDFAWSRRAGVTHKGREIDKDEASRLLETVSDFIEQHS